MKVNALKVFGTGLAAFANTDRSVAHDIVALVGRYTLSSDARVRSAAFEALLEMNRRGQVSKLLNFCLLLLTMAQNKS